LSNPLRKGKGVVVYEARVRLRDTGGGVNLQFKRDEVKGEKG